MKPHKVLLIFLSVALFSCIPTSNAEVSVNVPVGHWPYNAIDKLTSLGLIKSHMLTTRPVTRLEMARLVREGKSNFDAKIDTLGPGPNNIAKSILSRLESEFDPEIQVLTGTAKTSTYLKPLEDTYLSYHHSKEGFSFENDRGREYSDGSSFKAGLSSHGILFKHFGFYINPEFRYSNEQFGDRDYRLSLMEGYGKLEWYNIELEMGRDSMWWGPGRHGSLILTDNAKPFDLIKISNPKPVVLPWLLRHLGLVRFNAFWAKLERSRYVPEPEFMGFRLDVKPFPFLELGASRTILLGGKGDKAAKGVADLSFSDWLKLLGGQNLGGSLDTDQIAGMDAVLHLEDIYRFLPIFNTLDLWGELYGEDEAAHLPSRNGFVLGIRLGDLFLTGRTNLFIEHADNVIHGHPNFWYNHHVYKSGYTYYGRIMGHEMGSEARDTMVGIEHYLKPDIIVTLNYIRQKRGVSSKAPESRDRYGAQVTWWKWINCHLEAGYRYESIENMDGLERNHETNHIFWLSLNYSL